MIKKIKRLKKKSVAGNITDIVDPPLDIIYEKYPKYRILARNEIVKHDDEYAPGGYPVYHQYRHTVKK